MRAIYEKPNMAIEKFDIEDVITLSGGAGGPNPPVEQQEEPVTSSDTFAAAPSVDTLSDSTLDGAVEDLYDNMVSDQ